MEAEEKADQTDSSTQRLFADVKEIDEIEEIEETKVQERPRTIVAFFMFGLLIYATYSLIISGAQDILHGTLVPTSAVLVANIGPYFAVTTVAPYFIQRIPYFPRVFTVFLLETSGLVMVVVGQDVSVKLVGVGFSSTGFGLGELSFIAMTSFYDDAAVRAFSAGTGAGIALAPLYYTAMTTWACIPPNTAISIMAVCLVLLLVFYGVMDRKHSHDFCETKAGDSYTSVPYKPIEVDSTDADSKARPTMTFVEKVSAVTHVLPIMLCVVFAWTAEYLIIQSVITTIAFVDAPFLPRDHYQYYIFVFLSGEFFGRSYLIFFSYVKPSLVPKLIVKNLWGLTIAEVAILVFFIFAAWYRFLPDVSIPLIISFIAGIIIGIMYVNMLSVFSSIKDDTQREFVLGYASAATGCGALTAGLLGLVLEPWLRRHCLQVSLSSEYCFTRSIGKLNTCGT